MRDDSSIDEPSPLAARILVIDDDRQIREAVKWALEDEGFEVQLASSGQEAVALAREWRPDLVVLDFTLTELNGRAIAASLRAVQSRPLPILLITGDGQAAWKAEQVGAYAFVRKPFQLEELVQTILSGLPRLD